MQAHTDELYSNWWTLNLTSTTLGGEQLMQNSGQHYAILDTGTSLITISKTMFDDFKVKLQNSVTGFNCDVIGEFCVSLQQSCENYYADMPTLEFELSDGNQT